MLPPCIAPTELRDGDLAAAAGGAASPAVLEHLRRCPACADEVAALAGAGLALYAGLYRRECPSTDVLLDAVRGAADIWTARAVRAHVSDCKDCQQEQSLLALPDASAQGVWAQLKAAGAALVHAALTPWTSPALAVRGESASERLYAADGCEVLLTVGEPLAGLDFRAIEGQLTLTDGDLAEGILVGLLEGDAVIAEDRVDEFGYFALGPVPPGAYRLWLQLAAGPVIVSPLPIP